MPRFVLSPAGAVATAALLASLIALPAAAYAEPPPPWAERVKASLVEAETPWQMAYGVLVGDRQTAFVAGFFFDSGRPIAARTVAVPEVEVGTDARVYDPGDVTHPVYVLALADPVEGEPLALSDAEPELDQRVWLLLDGPAGFRRPELAQAKVNLVAESRFSVDTAGLRCLQGTPVLDDDGRLMGLLDWDGQVTRVGALAVEDELEARSTDVLPLIGTGIGVELGGLMDTAFTLHYDFGVTLWDRLSLVGRVGLLANGDGPKLETVTGEGGVAAATVDRSLGVRLGMEGRYRSYLGGGESPLYVDLVGGFHWTINPALVTGESFAPCATCEGGVTSVEVDSLDAFDATVGLDLRWNVMSLGYRFSPGLGAAPAAHQLTFGVAIF